ncbi:hypothetical protein MUN81_08465 [Hymenobacter sp. 5317J-9]|uniref:hypothetical protein n=1 Tax=Hymenobacter sp. 5317J-9 TaxID=2932250 RepID=UPI001FD6DF08|nr:hypothetical protein [Hymenobacter sp. 5317J-9]UOQ99510.1 hypothetical protein MUN81_08465 [Hymenobacter sp. 5317J-9]
MKKPEIPPMHLVSPAKGQQFGHPVKAVVQQPVPAGAVSSGPGIPSVPPAAFAGAAGPYVDPYLFETGYYASQAEYNELQRTAASRIRLRADAENAHPKRRPR